MRKKISKTLRVAVFARDGQRCVLCGWGGPDEGWPNPVRTFELDHIVPVLAGGRNTLENLRVTCTRCNARKGARCPESAR